MTHRNLVVGAVSLTRVRLKNEALSVLGARNEVEAQLTANSFLASAPFRTVSLILRYTGRDDWQPESYEIDKEAKVLNIAIEFDAEKLKAMSQPELQETFRTAIIESLCDVAANYDLPFHFLDSMRRKQVALAQQSIEADAASPRRLT
ncbi:MAG: Imm39 family immunity protein [Nevskia sp.]|nr:Imm39 family immunity protein [Nevskia sp.]